MNRLTSVLHIIAASRRLGDPPVPRTTLVKLTFLCEILRPSYELHVRAHEFIRYHYGPYSRSVLAAASALVFHRLAVVEGYARKAGSVRAQYFCSELGLQQSEALASRSREERMALHLAEDVVAALQSAGIRGVARVCDLVYAEPQFATVFAAAEGGEDTLGQELMSPQDPEHPSFRLQAYFSQHPAVYSASSPEMLVRSFVAYLAANAAQQKLSVQ